MGSQAASLARCFPHWSLQTSLFDGAFLVVPQIALVSQFANILIDVLSIGSIVWLLDALCYLLEQLWQ